MTLVYLGLGSNLGDRAGNLWDASRRVHELARTRIARLSPLYETEPIGPAQNWFLNAVVELETSLPALDLLTELKRIENAMGRVPAERWGPRVIDLDILLYGDEHIATSELTVPHSELWNRRFVLIPLLDLLPSGILAEQARRRLEALDPGVGEVRSHAGDGC